MPHKTGKIRIRARLQASRTGIEIFESALAVAHSKGEPLFISRHVVRGARFVVPACKA